MGIDNLPGAGNNFRLKGVASSFNTKLKSATMYGSKNLKPHVGAITKVVAKYEDFIKHKGGLSRLQQIAAWNNIKKISGETTPQTRREIKKILSNLGKSDSSLNKRPVNKKGEKILVEAEKRRNVRASQRSYEGSDSTSAYQKTSVNYAGGKQTTSSRIGVGEIAKKSGTNRVNVGGINSKKNKRGLGLGTYDRKGVGFARDFNKKASPKISPTKGLGGKRPIGL